MQVIKPGIRPGHGDLRTCFCNLGNTLSHFNLKEEGLDVLGCHPNWQMRKVRLSGVNQGTIPRLDVFGIPLPSMTGPKIFVESVPEPEDSSPVLTWSWGTSGVSPGESVLVSSGACTCAFLSSCSSSVTLPFAWIKGSVAFPRGFHTRLSHEAFPQGCPTCHLGVSRSSA